MLAEKPSVARSLISETISSNSVINWVVFVPPTKIFISVVHLRVILGAVPNSNPKATSWKYSITLSSYVLRPMGASSSSEHDDITTVTKKSWRIFRYIQTKLTCLQLNKFSGFIERYSRISPLKENSLPIRKSGPELSNFRLSFGHLWKILPGQWILRGRYNG